MLIPRNYSVIFGKKKMRVLLRPAFVRNVRTCSITFTQAPKVSNTPTFKPQTSRL